MKTAITTAIILSTLISSVAYSKLPQAGPEASKPTVCRTWTVMFDSKGQKAGVLCTDRKTPKLLTEAYEFTATDKKTGRKARYVVGN